MTGFFTTTTSALSSYSSQDIMDENFFKLTPVKIKKPIIFSDTTSNTNDTTSSSIKRTPSSIHRIGNTGVSIYKLNNNNHYNENFLKISKELETLLNNINVIYNEIGYPLHEINERETSIFNELSQKIHQFFTKANTEKLNISIENENILQILRLILKSMGDQRGINTIPDLYIRNMIVLSQQDLSPSKREISLLNKRKILSDGLNFVFQKFLVALKHYLQLCLDYNQIMKLLGETQDSNCNNLNDNSIFILDESKCQDINQLLLASQVSMDSISQFFIQDFQNHKTTSILNQANFSTEGLDKIRNKIVLLRQKYDDRMFKLKNSIQDILDLALYLEIDLQAFMLKNDINDERVIKLILFNTKSDYKAMDSKLIIPTSLLDTLQTIIKTFLKIKENRESERDSLHEKCVELWSKLKISKEEITNFMNDKIEIYKGMLPPVVIMNYQQQHEALLKLKRESIKQLIETTMVKIMDLWDSMGFSAIEREPFLTFYNENFAQSNKNTNADDENGNDLVLNRCERELSILEEKYKLYEPILKNIALFETYQEDKKKLEKSSKDPSRLLCKNSNKILLYEERTRKKISRHFPLIIQSLKEKLINFESQFNRPFINYRKGDMPYLDIVLEQEKEILTKYPKSRMSIVPKVTSNRDVSVFGTTNNGTINTTRMNAYNQHQHFPSTKRQKIGEHINNNYNKLTPSPYTKNKIGKSPQKVSLSGKNISGTVYNHNTSSSSRTVRFRNPLTTDIYKHNENTPINTPKTNRRLLIQLSPSLLNRTTARRPNLGKTHIPLPKSFSNLESGKDKENYTIKKNTDIINKDNNNLAISTRHINNTTSEIVTKQDTTNKTDSNDVINSNSFTMGVEVSLLDDEDDDLNFNIWQKEQMVKISNNK
ncbi:uncharacterized protein SCODWIG_03409 [Saccharomycodes ludwigii]|uniref:Anaphase spindle elongation protein n=2 Tax=Saccharomycodes ludwigii TaxID=36035 RepID=A0A376BAC4_9ASCO|nr:uncharacterized protein SCODWIG_03409 [Saccharomycodes ludwigii]